MAATAANTTAGVQTPSTTAAQTGLGVASTVAADPTVGQITGQESALSNYVGPYVTEMLGRGQALGSMGYQANGGVYSGQFY